MTDPIIQEVMALIGKSGKSVTKIEEECGFGYRTISRWRTKNGANLYNVQAVLNYLGYKLSIEKLSEEEKVHNDAVKDYQYDSRRKIWS